MKQIVLGLVVLLLTLALAACGDEEPTTVAGEPSDQRYTASATVLESPDHGPQLCLGGVQESYPPQCGGPDIVGWDWAEVDTKESASGTTWATVSVVGTWDGERLTLTQPPGPPVPTEGEERDFSPACDDFGPSGEAAWSGEGVEGLEDVVTIWVSDPAGDWDGPFVVNVVVRPGSKERVETAIREHWDGALCVVERDQPTSAELAAIQEEITASRNRPFEVLTVSADELRGVVVVGVVVVDDAARAWAEERFGDLVELDGALRPV